MRISTIKRAGLAIALSLCLGFGVSAQTFLHDGVVYQATGLKLKVLDPHKSTASKPIVPENGDLPADYTGDIVVPGTIEYNSKTYTVTDVASGFKGHPITSISLPETVTQIKIGAFDGCAELTTVVLPAKLTSIAQKAFNNCAKLKEVTLPGTLTKLANEIFKGCTSLEKFTVENGEGTIAVNAALFGADGTSALKEIYIYRALDLEKITAMTDKPFRGVKTLEKAVLGGTCTELNASFFENCSALKTVTLESEFTALGTNTFAGTALEEFTLPAAITEVPSMLFANTPALNKVTLGDGVTTISALAFSNSNISEINLPAALETIGDMAFQRCPKLAGELVLPAAVKRVGEQAFAGTAFTKVSVPAATVAIGNGAFFDNAALASFEVSAENTAYGAAVNHIYSKTDNSVLAYAPAAPETSFTGNYAAVAPYAFYGAAKLEEIKLPACQNFGDHCFQGTSVKEMSLSGVVGRYVLRDCKALTKLSVDTDQVPFGVATDCTALTEVSLNKNLTVVKQDAFKGTTALESLDLGNVLAILEADCFAGSGLKNIKVASHFPSAMAAGVFTESSAITATVPADRVDAYKEADGWKYLTIEGDANLAAQGADMGMPAGLYYAGDDGVLHCAYEEGEATHYDVGGIPHTFQLLEFNNRIYGACAGQKFVYSATGATDGDGKLFYISKVGGNIFQAVVLDNTGNNAYKDPFGLYIYGEDLYVNDRNVAVRIIPASAIALPQDYPSWIENNWMYFYGANWSYGCIKNGFAITSVEGANGQPEPLYWLGMKYNGEGIYRFRTANVGTSSAEVGTKPVEEPFFTNMKPIITTFQVDEKNGHLYMYVETGMSDADTKGGLYRVNLADLEANPNPATMAEVNAILIDGSPVKYEGAGANEHVGISQLAFDRSGEYLYWCYRAPTKEEAEANEAQTPVDAAKGQYYWADKYDENNPLHHSGIKRIKLGEANPTVEMVVPGVSGYGVADAGYAGSKNPSLGVVSVVAPEAELVSVSAGVITAAEDAEVSVYAVSGMLVSRQALAAGESAAIEAQAGAYIVVAKTAAAKQTLKVVL